MALFRATAKTKVFAALILLLLFCLWEIWNGSNIHIVDLHDIWIFQNRILGSLRSFDFKCILPRQTSERVAYKPWNLLECFLRSTVARIMSVLPEKFQKFPKLGGCSPPSPRPPAHTPMKEENVRHWLSKKQSYSVIIPHPSSIAAKDSCRNSPPIYHPMVSWYYPMWRAFRKGSVES